MKIGVIQASSQSGKNRLLFDLTCEKAFLSEVVNFGCFEEEKEQYSYIEISLQASLLLAAGAVDFIVTGCSSGQGMMLALNSFPGVICGYLENPQDAYLFGRINNGNAASLPLGLNFGWSGEINLAYTLAALFEEPFGTGYPPEDAARKQADTLMLKKINALSGIRMTELLERLDQELVTRALRRKNVTDYILQYGTDKELVDKIALFTKDRERKPVL